jgi:hypothetical protein
MQMDKYGEFNVCIFTAFYYEHANDDNTAEPTSFSNLTVVQ